MLTANVKDSKKILEKRRSDRNKLKNLDWCLLDGLLDISETNTNFNDEDIIDEACTFMMAVNYLFL